MPAMAFPSAGGRGWVYQYFKEDAPLRDILFLTHGVCLAHGEDEPESQPKCSQAVQIFQTADVGGNRFSPTQEKLWLFLVFSGNVQVGLVILYHMV